MKLEVEKSLLLKIAHLTHEAQETNSVHARKECLTEVLRQLCYVLDLSREQLRNDWLLGYHHGED